MGLCSLVWAQSWKPAYLGIRGGTVTASWMDTRTGIVFAGTQRSGLFTSRDGGQTWSSANDHLGLLPIRRIFAENSAAVIAETGQAPNLVWFETEDGGQTWRDRKGDVDTISPVSTSIALSENRMVSWASGQVLLSEDGGKTWQDRSPANHVRVLTFIATPNSSWLAGAEHEGLFQSRDDGRTWQSLDLAAVSGDNLLRDGQALILETELGWFRSDDEAASWAKIPQTESLSAFSIRASGAWIALQNGQTLVTSEDQGGQWRVLGTFSFQSTALTEYQQQLYLGTADGGLYRTDGHTTTPLLEATSGIAVREIHPVDHGLLVVWQDGHLTRSEDAGQTWSRVTTPFREAEHVWVTRHGVALVRTSRGLHRSQDGGITWEAAQTTWYDALEVHQVVEAPDGTLYAVNARTRWQSVNGGATWSIAGSVPETLPIRALGFSRRGTLLAAVAGNGVWELDAPVILRHSSEKPQKTGISALFPQPAQETATLIYAASNAHQVQIFDLNGRRLRVWQVSGTTSGTQTVSIPVHQWASGTYLLTIEGQSIHEKHLLTIRH